MRYRVLIFFALFLFPLFVEAACSSSGYTVIFANGIFNTREEAQSSADSLQDKLGEEFNSEILRVKLAYNARHLAGVGDLVETALPQFDQYDLETILTQIHGDVTTRKLLIVGHSQGAVYANKIYEYLKEHGVPKEDMAVYAVASPDSYVAGGGKYITYTLDDVINNWARLLGTAIPLQPNATFAEWFNNHDHGATAAQGHGFIDMYLGGFGTRIVREMRGELAGLQNIAGSATEGCFDPPPPSLGRKVTGAAFAVGDPLALGIAAGSRAAGAAAVVVGKTTALALDGLVNGIDGLGRALGFGGGESERSSGVSGLDLAGFSLLKAVAGSSLNIQEVIELNSQNQGAAVASALDKKKDKGEVLGAEIQNPATTTHAAEPGPPPGNPEGPAMPKGPETPLVQVPGGGLQTAPSLGGVVPPEQTPFVNNSTSTPTTTVPTAPVVVSVSSDGVTYASANTSPVSITITFDQSVASTSVLVNGATQTTNSCGGASGATMCFDFALPLTEPGLIQTLTIIAVDSTNASTSINTAHTFVVDTLGPVVVVNNKTTKLNLPTITGTNTEANALVQVLLNNLYYLVQASGGVWSLTLSSGAELPEGSYTVTASSTDSVGNMGSAAQGTLVIDLTAPVVTQTSGPNEGDTVSSPVSIGYSASDNVGVASETCAYDADLIVACSNPSAATLSAGTHTFTLYVTDAAGNQTVLTRNFTVN